MKDGKITVVLDKEDSKKFDEISKRSNWQDKFIVSIALRDYYKKFKKDWKKEVIEALENDKK
jgi:hypothetical protein